MTTVAVTKSEKPNTNTWTYLLLTTLFSSFFYFLIIKSGQLAGGNRFYVLGLMWCPGLAALLTLKLNKRSFSELGWSLGDNKYLLQSYLVQFPPPMLLRSELYQEYWRRIDTVRSPAMLGCHQDQKLQSICSLFLHCKMLRVPMSI